MLEEGPAGAAALVLVSCKPNSMILVRFPNPLAPGNMSVGKPNSMILVFHIWISVWIIQATVPPTLNGKMRLVVFCGFPY